MRKSEHTELATLSRLAVYVSVHGLDNLTYGHAAQAAHLSKGALQRLFPDRERMQLAVVCHAAQLLNQHVFQYDRIGTTTLSTHLQRWSAWICGDSGLPGGCVLLAVLSARGLAARVLEQAKTELNAFLRRLLATHPAQDRAQNWLIAAFALHAFNAWTELDDDLKASWIAEFPNPPTAR